jgi:hypothetical protein
MTEFLRSLNLFNRRAKEIQGSEEIPWDFYIVVADDESHFRDQTNTELGDFLKNFPNSRVGISNPTSTRETIRESVKGNRGNQANLVLLDTALEHRQDRWKLDPYDMFNECKRLGIKFPITKDDRNVPFDIIEKRINGLTRGGDSLALVLRMCGYTGTLCTLSNTSTHDIWLSGDVKNMEEVIPDLAITKPIIDRRLGKVGFTRGSFISGTASGKRLENPLK